MLDTGSQIAEKKMLDKTKPGATQSNALSWNLAASIEYLESSIKNRESIQHPVSRNRIQDWSVNHGQHTHH
jgi:hypothetical protein